MPDDLTKDSLIAHIASRDDLPSIKHGEAAMRAAGAQPEFVAHNMLQAQALGINLILRAGTPPQYNKKRSPKSGLNLTKTSNQGLFKGALALESRFGRLDAFGHPMGLDKKDSERIAKKNIFDIDYQHRMQLDLTMQDILRELDTDGDLKVVDFNLSSLLLTLEYKEGKGPPRTEFNGLFVIDLADSDDTPMLYMRPWDKPEAHPDYIEEEKIIRKPESLACLDDELYKMHFHNRFKLYYCETKELPDREELKPAMVLANRARDAEAFLRAIPVDHPQYEALGKCNSLQQMLNVLKPKAASGAGRDVAEDEAAAAFIKAIYDKTGAIVAGDWDGLAIGHPPALHPDFRKVYNTFSPIDVDGTDQAMELLNAANTYLANLKSAAHEKDRDKRTPLDKLVLETPEFNDTNVGNFALMRAGCITPFEFVYQQLINISYRDELNRHYGEPYDLNELQNVMNDLLAHEEDPTTTQLKQKIALQLARCLPPSMSRILRSELEDHLLHHFNIAKKTPDKPYTLPHLKADLNIKNLFQHGFDMRNPYGSNLDGAWLMISKDGSILYGQTQEELVEVLLTPGYLEQNYIDINWGADMAAGWARVIDRQLELKQPIPDKTIIAFTAYLKDKGDTITNSALQIRLENALKNCPAEDVAKPEDRFRPLRQKAVSWQADVMRPKPESSDASQRSFRRSFTTAKPQRIHPAPSDRVDQPQPARSLEESDVETRPSNPRPKNT